MLKKSTTNRLWLAVCLVFISSIGMEGIDRQYTKYTGQPKVDFITIRLNNETKYKLLLHTWGEAIAFRGLNTQDFYPFSRSDWVLPHTKRAP